MKLSWLGQAGYRIVTDKGRIMMIDPYLSDTLRMKKGESYRREVAIKDEILDEHVDILVFTHLHDDHLDFGTVDRILAANGPVAILGSMKLLDAMRARYARPENYMLFDPGVEITLDDVHFTSVFAAHSSEKPIGLIIEADGKTLCHTGDTMYHRQLLLDYPKNADALILPINGSGYNMNAADAARLTRALSPKAVLPMHWDMFKAYGCDVNDFVAQFDGAQKIIIPRHYDCFEI